VGPKAPRLTVVSLLALVLTCTATIAFEGSPVGAKNLPLKPLVLTVKQMPTGWVISHSSSGSGCGQPKGVKVMQDVTVSFGETGQQLVEDLRTYSVAVESAYMRLLKVFNRCTHERIVIGGKPITANIGQMSLPTFGNDSEAFDARVRHNGKLINIYETVIRSGNIIVTMTERGTDLGQFEDFTKLALARLPFGGTAPVTPTASKTPTTITPTTTASRPSPPTTTKTRLPSLPATTTTRQPPLSVAPVTSPLATTTTVGTITMQVPKFIGLPDVPSRPGAIDFQSPWLLEVSGCTPVPPPSPNSGSGSEVVSQVPAPGTYVTRPLTAGIPNIPGGWNAVDVTIEAWPPADNPTLDACT
jgi:hypothetical protein